jgi:hypothetical protein
MEPRAVRIRYGLIRHSQSPKASRAYLTARSSLFPNCDDTIMGGCIRPRGMRPGEKFRVRDKNVCPECCRVRDAWLRENFPDWADGV